MSRVSKWRKKTGSKGSWSWKRRMREESLPLASWEIIGVLSDPFCQPPASLTAILVCFSFLARDTNTTTTTMCLLHTRKRQVDNLYLQQEIHEKENVENATLSRSYKPVNCRGVVHCHPCRALTRYERRRTRMTRRCRAVTRYVRSWGGECWDERVGKTVFSHDVSFVWLCDHANAFNSSRSVIIRLTKLARWRFAHLCASIHDFVASRHFPDGIE